MWRPRLHLGAGTAAFAALGRAAAPPVAARPRAAAAGPAAQPERPLSTLKIAGVPEHFNAPFHLAEEKGLYAERGVRLAWHCEPKGTGAMAQLVEAGDVDVAVMLSEGAVARAAAGAGLKVVGTYVRSPLRWGIHVRHGGRLRDPADLRGRVFGVSRMLSGSHLMAHVFAIARGWDLEQDAPLKVVGTLDGAREAMSRGEIDAWLWEKFTTKHLVDSHEWDIIGEVPTPWPCFVFAASVRALTERRGELRAVVEATREVCEEFKANLDDSTLDYVAENHRMSSKDASEWLQGTEWACVLEVDATMLRSTQQALVTIGQLTQAVPYSQLVDSEVCRLNGL